MPDFGFLNAAATGICNAMVAPLWIALYSYARFIGFGLAPVLYAAWIAITGRATPLWQELTT